MKKTCRQLSARPAAHGERGPDYQTNSAGDAVDIIDSTTNTVVLQVKHRSTPRSRVLSRRNPGLHSCEAEDTLWATDTATGKLLGKAALSGHPNNIAISRDGRRGVFSVSWPRRGQLKWWTRRR